MEQEPQEAVGTPKTLREAIENGVKSWTEGKDKAPELSGTIEKHVQDYLAQKFTVQLYKCFDPPTVHQLWKRITGKEIGS